MGRMRKVIYIILIIVVWLPLVLFLFYRYSDAGERATRNLKNIKDVELGMSKEQVFVLMGKPQDKYVEGEKPHPVDSIYFYITPIWAGAGIEVHLDSAGFVYLINAEGHFDF